MVIGTFISKFNVRDRFTPTKTSGPLLNSMMAPYAQGVYYRSTVQNIKRRLVQWYREHSPELTALVNMVAGDLAEESFFEPVEKSASGRNKVLKAETFCREVNMRKQDFSSFVDLLVTGEAYAWMGKLDKSKVDRVVKERMDYLGLPETKEVKEIYMMANKIDEDLIRPAKYQYIASSTMENLFNDTQIFGFYQRVGVDEREFKPEEVIHYVFYDIDGRPEGFTPVYPMVTQLELLRFMWRNMYSMSRNGGQPDRIFSVQDVDANTPAFKRIEEEFKKYVHMDNRHGSLLLNGKVEVVDLVQLDSMQYKEMGLYVTGLLATQWRIPRSRISYIVDGTNTKDDTGGNSEKAYWRNIEMLQDSFLAVQNSQLWIPLFGVMRKFKKAYKHDELVETQVTQQRLNNLTFLSNELAKVEKRLTPDYIIRYVNGYDETLDEEDIEDAPQPVIDNSQMRQGLQSNKSVRQSQDDKNKSDKKKQQQAVAQRNSNNTGYGKESELSIKEEFGTKERQRVNYSSFVKIYNEDKAFNKNPPRVFISENDGITRFAYMSTDFVYETMVPSSEVSKASLMNFIKVYKVDESEILEALDNTGVEVQ